jgi:four helix bundle protein
LEVRCKKEKTPKIENCEKLVLYLIMGVVKSLEDIEVYKEPLNLTKEIFQMCKDTHLRMEYSLCDQAKRASVSVCANVSQGYGRKTKADFSHFLSIALGSCNEVIALLDVVRLNFPDVETEPVEMRYKVLCRRLFSFRKNLI